MPTGYTAKLMEEGQSFKDFAMTCARAFGACVEMRDDPMDAPIPEEFKPSDYSVKALAAAQAKLATLSRMTAGESIAFGIEQRRKALESNAKWLEKEKAEQARLDTMAAQVKEWTPPTTDHQGLKDFMLDQIKISSGHIAYIAKVCDETRAKAPLDFFNEAVKAEQWSVEYNTKAIAEERERAKSRTAWVKQLRQSLV